MKTDIITIPTVTMALKAKKLLSKQGIKAKVVNINGDINSNGCSYGIEFSSTYYFSVIAILKDSEIPHKHLKRTKNDLL